MKKLLLILALSLFLLSARPFDPNFVAWYLTPVGLIEVIYADKEPVYLGGIVWMDPKPDCREFEADSDYFYFATPKIRYRTDKIPIGEFKKQQGFTQDSPYSYAIEYCCGRAK